MSDPHDALRRLTDELEAHDGPNAEHAEALRKDITEALDTDDHVGLGDRLTEAAVHFRTDHPDLAAVIERAARLLGDAGL